MQENCKRTEKKGAHLILDIVVRYEGSVTRQVTYLAPGDKVR
jgi:hypothetical protein